MKEMLKKLSIKELKASIHKYGLSYSTKDFVIESSAIMMVILLVAWFSRMRHEYMAVLLGLGFVLTPFLIAAWFTQMYNIRRFTQLCDYLGNIIPVFMQKTKIRYTLGELYELTSGEMKESIYKAISYIDSQKNDVDLEKNALKIIEEKFSNSRVRSVHKLLLSIENVSSESYEDVCASMHEDIEQWIKRVYVFQKDLKDRRNKLLILCGLTLAMNCLFVYIYINNEYFAGFTDMSMYQLSTLLFTASILIVIVAIMTRLNGGWLVDDIGKGDEDRLKKKYLLYKNYAGKADLVYVLMAAIFFVIGAYLFYIDEILLSCLSLLFAIYVFTEKRRKRDLAFSSVSRSMEIEFPVWLREISLNLNHLTVLNAIENSLNTVSYPFRCELKTFLRDAKADPTSIAPYSSFLHEYDLEDGRSSMKVLYGIQNLGRENMRSRVNGLIERNEEMLAKSETIRNDDSISGIEFIGYLPTLIFTCQMMVSMFTMFGFMMTSIGRVGAL